MLPAFNVVNDLISNINYLHYKFRRAKSYNTILNSHRNSYEVVKEDYFKRPVLVYLDDTDENVLLEVEYAERENRIYSLFTNDENLITSMIFEVEGEHIIRKILENSSYKCVEQHYITHKFAFCTFITTYKENNRIRHGQYFSFR